MWMVDGIQHITLRILLLDMTLVFLVELQHIRDVND